MDEAARLSLMERLVESHAEEMREVRLSLRQLTAVSERQTSIIERMDGFSKSVTDHEARLRALEKDHPKLVESRGWFVQAVTASLVALATVFFTSLATKQPTLPYQQVPELRDRRSAAN